MTIWTTIRHWLSGDHQRRHLAERDAPAEPGGAHTPSAGGVDDPDAPGRHSTTGTTPSDTFVGQAGGDDPGEVDGPRHRRGDDEKSDA
jgi:hypothetical protein